MIQVLFKKILDKITSSYNFEDSDDSNQKTVILSDKDPILTYITSDLQTINKYNSLQQFTNIKIETQVEEKTKNTLLICDSVDKNNIIAELHSQQTIYRYLGLLGRMISQKNIVNFAIVDNLLELHRDFMFPILVQLNPENYGLHLTKEEKEKHLLWCNEKHIPKYLDIIEDELNSSIWLGMLDRMSAADLCWYDTLKWILNHEEFKCKTYHNILEYFNAIENFKEDQEDKEEDEGKEDERKKEDEENEEEEENEEDEESEEEYKENEEDKKKYK